MKRPVLLLVVSLIAFLFVSCQTPPAADPTVDVPQKSISRTFPEFVTKARAVADENRAKALEVRANVAAKALFDQGENGLNAGKRLQDQDSFEEAATNFTSAAEFYQKAYAETVVKRDRALAAMKQAEQDRIATEEVLREADTAQKAGGIQ